MNYQVERISSNHISFHQMVTDAIVRGKVPYVVEKSENFPTSEKSRSKEVSLIFILQNSNFPNISKIYLVLAKSYNSAKEIMFVYLIRKQNVRM